MTPHSVCSAMPQGLLVVVRIALTIIGSRSAGHQLEIDIAAKEMVPVVAAAAVGGRGWCRHQVTFHSDNAAVVSVIQ